MLVTLKEFNHFKFIGRGTIEQSDTNDQKVNLLINKKLSEYKNES